MSFLQERLLITLTPTWKPCFWSCVRHPFFLYCLRMMENLHVLVTDLSVFFGMSFCFMLESNVKKKKKKRGFFKCPGSLAVHLYWNIRMKKMPGRCLYLGGTDLTEPCALEWTGGEPRLCRKSAKGQSEADFFSAPPYHNVFWTIHFLKHSTSPSYLFLFLTHGQIFSYRHKESSRLYK